ncbi:MAG TPA: hypothetical protein VG097_20350 [Gemmata sp.]|jgi:uncharacterized protein (TIGR03066 family)|nr:hypothetical protein [Gemmata sp.]
MKGPCVAAMAVAMFAFAGAGHAQDDNTKKIIATWELTKSGGDLLVGTMIEFAKEPKLNITIKDAMGDFKLEGTYKVEKDKLTVKVTISNEMIEETFTIKKLTDDILEVEDKDKKVNAFKKKK